MREELLKGLTEEQIAKIKNCKSTDDVLALAKQEGIELSDEQLEAVSGGCSTDDSGPITCPKCGSTDVTYYPMRMRPGKFSCNNCRNVFTRD